MSTTRAYRGAAVTKPRVLRDRPGGTVEKCCFCDALSYSSDLIRSDQPDQPGRPDASDQSGRTGPADWLRTTRTTRAAPSRSSLLGRRLVRSCLLYTSPSPRDGLLSRMPSSA